MGDMSGNGASDERPTHQVMTEGFYLGKYEVTKAQYELVMTEMDWYSATPYSGGGTGENTPVGFVSYNEVVAFIDRLNDQQVGNIQNGWEYALPTEAHWNMPVVQEAHRRGSFDVSDPSYDLSIGDIYTDAQGLLELNGSGRLFTKTPFSYKNVGHYPPNSWGFHDMSGNAAEWVADWLELYTGDSLTDPLAHTMGRNAGSVEEAWKIKEFTRPLPIGGNTRLKRYRQAFVSPTADPQLATDGSQLVHLVIAENQPIGTIV